MGLVDRDRADTFVVGHGVVFSPVFAGCNDISLRRACLRQIRRSLWKYTVSERALPRISRVLMRSTLQGCALYLLAEDP